MFTIEQNKCCNRNQLCYLFPPPLGRWGDDKMGEGERQISVCLVDIVIMGDDLKRTKQESTC